MNEKIKHITQRDNNVHPLNSSSTTTAVCNYAIQAQEGQKTLIKSLMDKDGFYQKNKDNITLE